MTVVSSRQIGADRLELPPVLTAVWSVTNQLVFEGHDTLMRHHDDGRNIVANEVHFMVFLNAQELT